MKSVNPALLLAVSFLAFSCAKEQRPAAKAGAAGETRQSSAHAGITGRIQDTTKTLLTGAHRSACDDKIEPLRQEIAAAIDARAAAILDYKTKNSIGDNYKAVPFGPTFVQERVTAPNPEDGWAEEVTPFSYYSDLYQKAKASGAMKDWSELNDQFRGWLLDEEGRIVKGYNYQLGREHVEPARQLWREIRDCDAKPDCTVPTLSEASRIFVESQFRYKEELAKVGAAASREKAREELKNFFDYVTGDVRYWDFKPNPAIRLTGESTWSLAVDPGPFANAGDQYKRYFHELWQADGGKVILELSQGTGLFRSVLGDEVGGRSKVNLDKKEIILMPGLRARTLAHELGHVIGFPDNYFSVFNPADCSYRDQSRPSDLMSSSATGQVLPEHWATMAVEFK